MERIENESLLILPVVSELTGIDVKTIHTFSEKGLFPSSVKIDDDEVWISSDIANWLETEPYCLPDCEWEMAA
jgi:predicted DNA-binding transcriptional regulator AlpA